MSWTHKDTIAVGGLENIGYAPGQDLLLVLSSQGQGIIDCRQGTLVARLRNGQDWWEAFNEADGTIAGFGPLDGITVATSGLYGEDRLPKSTPDGWTLLLSDPEPDDAPFEKYLVQRVYLAAPQGGEKRFIAKDGACELRAFGFSDTGKSFVVATSCDLTIYSRQ